MHPMKQPAGGLHKNLLYTISIHPRNLDEYQDIMSWSRSSFGNPGEYRVWEALFGDGFSETWSFRNDWAEVPISKSRTITTTTFLFKNKNQFMQFMLYWGHLPIIEITTHE